MQNIIVHNLWVIKFITILTFGSHLISCEKTLNFSLTAEPVIGMNTFNSTQGLKLPYEIYMPSSMTGWNLDTSTRFIFDEKRMIYFLDNIPLNNLPVDEQGYRFKVCSASWRYQFGFGSYITDDESTIGIPTEGIVVRAERFPQVATDIRIERYPQASTDIRIEIPPANKSGIKKPMLRVEFKLVQWEPKPEALLYLSIHDDSGNIDTIKPSAQNSSSNTAPAY